MRGVGNISVAMGSSLSGDLKKARGNAELLERVASSLAEYPHPSEKEMAMALQYAIEARSAAAAKAFAFTDWPEPSAGSRSRAPRTPRLDHRVAVEAIASGNPAAAAAVAAVFADPHTYMPRRAHVVKEVLVAIVLDPRPAHLLATAVLAAQGNGYDSPIHYRHMIAEYVEGLSTHVSHVLLVLLLGGRPCGWKCECEGCRMMAAGRVTPYAVAWMADYFVAVGAVYCSGNHRWFAPAIMGAAYRAYSNVIRGSDIRMHSFRASSASRPRAPEPTAPESAARESAACDPDAPGPASCEPGPAVAPASAAAPAPPADDPLAGDGAGPSGACAVCLEARPLAMCEPCAHFAACFPCARELRAAGAPCVMCRGPVAAWRRTFFA